METKPLRLTRGMVLRMAADALMIQVALATALAFRWLYLVVFLEVGSNAELGRLFWAFVGAYWQTAWPLTLLCLVVFYLTGIYTYGRFYQSRYRALVMFKSVGLAFLLYGFGTHFFLNVSPLPRSSLIMAWAFSTIMIVGARVWSQLWERIVHPERQKIIRSRRGPGRHVLVIGGAGYIGSALLPKLLDKGHRVRLMDLMVFGQDPIREFAGHRNLEILPGDFRHVESVVEAMQGVDSVVHLGAIVGDPACSLDENLTIDVNLSATRMVGELARAAGVERFIFASTCSVYGACDETLDEMSQVRPISLYGQTKLASEQVLWRMTNDRFLPTVVRFATIYGLSGRTRFDLVVNLLSAKAKMEGKITVFGGSQWRPFVHVDDAALAVSTILDAPRELVGGEIFNVGSNAQNYTITQIGELVHEYVPAAELLINDADQDKRNYRVDFSKLQNLLGFEPRWTVEQGIQQVLEAIANGDIRDYTEARYSNVKFLTESAAAHDVRRNWARELLQDLARQ
jgi:nucleoside-diphosphate-sugar epimerase